MAHEIELKLEISPADAARLSRSSLLNNSRSVSHREQTTYFDTPDRRLCRNGLSLRVREAEGRFTQTIKSLGNGAGLFDREEWETDVALPVPDLERIATAPVPDLDPNLLRPVVTTDVTRTAVRLNRGKSEVEVDLDSGAIYADGRNLRLVELELELVHGNPRRLFDIARSIAAEMPLKLCVLSKAERGFALVEQSRWKVSKPELVPAHKGMTVAEGFQAVVMSCVRHFRRNEPLIIAERNAEAVHQCRLATRRLRTALTLFEDAISGKRHAHFRSEVRWLGSVLGDARNIDIFLQSEPPAKMRELLEQRREVAYRRVIAALESGRARKLMLDLVEWTAVGKWRDRAIAARGFEKFAIRRIDHRWKTISRGRKLVSMPGERRHHLRISIKKLRYSLDFIAGLQPNQGRRKRFEDELAKLQDRLGEMNDLSQLRRLAKMHRDVWPIGELDEKQPRRLLRRSARSLRRLRKIGPYWGRKG